MASPQTEEGFVMIALDLLPAVMSLDIPNRCFIVLGEVLLNCYGPAKRNPPVVHLDPAQIEHYTGLGRKNARRAIGELCEAGILKSHEDGSYLFIKDYESWHPKGVPFASRLGGGPLRHCRSAIGRFGRGNRRSSPRTAPSQPDNDSTCVALQPESRISSQQTPTGVTQTSVTESNGSHFDKCNGVSLECGDRLCDGGKGESGSAPACAREEELEIREREELRILTARTGEGSLMVGAATPAVSARSESDQVIPIRNPGPGLGSPEAQALADWAEALGGNWSYWAQSKCRDYPAAWVKALLERKVQGCTPQPRQPYLNAILQEWVRRGECEYLVAPPARAAPKPRANWHTEMVERFKSYKGTCS